MVCYIEAVQLLLSGTEPVLTLSTAAGAVMPQTCGAGAATAPQQTWKQCLLCLRVQKCIDVNK
jgi:hypothetical protein